MSFVRRVGLGGVAVVGGLLGRSYLRKREAMQAVAPELRTPLLYAVPSSMSTTGLKVVRAIPLPATSPGPDVSVERRTITAADGEPLEVHVYESAGRARSSGALLWIHGGGMVMGDPDQDAPLCGEIARALGVVVVSPDYRLAPEHPFPTPPEDCYAALVWLHDQAAALGIDPARVAVAGASAGGGLAATVALMARDRSGPALAFQLLEYPMIDDRSAVATHPPARGAFLWTVAANRFGWAAYLGHEAGAPETRPWAVPSRTDDLSGLPPAWIGVGELDLFHDEDIDYAERLRAAGVECELHVEPGMYHGADAVVGRAPSMRAFRGRMVEALRPHISATVTLPA